MSTSGSREVAASVLLIGSVPLKSADEVMRTCGRLLGPYVRSFPDGETDDRIDWIVYLASQVYASHRDLEDLTSERASVRGEGRRLGGAPEKERQAAYKKFRIRDRTKGVVFDDLGYAAIASASYRTFAGLRDRGELPEDARFQVSLPTTAAAVTYFFSEPDDWPQLYDAYRVAIRGEIDKMLEAIPADDLVIQWDIATEVRDLSAGDDRIVEWAPPRALEDKWAVHLEDMEHLSTGIPESVLLGYHFCFGTWGGWPHSRVPDIALCTRLANEAVARAGRRVDYVHIPVMPDADEAFFAPLTNLDIGATKVYLGIVLDDGVEACVRRAQAARQFLPEFGIGSYCGLGRSDPADVPRTLKAMRDCAEALA